VTIADLKTQLNLQIEFFKSREQYKVDLRRAINKYGISALPKTVQDTIPTDVKTLYELPWNWNLYVWFRILQSTCHSAENEAIRRALNVS